MNESEFNFSINSYNCNCKCNLSNKNKQIIPYCCCWYREQLDNLIKRINDFRNFQNEKFYLENMFNYCDKITSQLKKQNNKKEDYLQENQSNSTMTDTIKNIVDIQTKVEKKNAKEIVNLKTLQITTSSPKKKKFIF